MVAIRSITSSSMEPDLIAPHPNPLPKGRGGKEEHPFSLGGEGKDEGES